MYAAVRERLRGTPHPVLDVGCGIGLMAFHLREQRIRAADHRHRSRRGEDRRGERDARVRRHPLHDRRRARRDSDAGSSVVLLDVLHYFDAEEQARILDNVARAVPPGGVAIIRDAVRDGSWRYRATYAAGAVRARGSLDSRRAAALSDARADRRARSRASTPRWCRCGARRRSTTTCSSSAAADYVRSASSAGMTNE